LRPFRIPIRLRRRSRRLQRGAGERLSGNTRGLFGIVILLWLRRAVAMALLTLVPSAVSEVLFETDFEKARLDEVPPEFTLLDGHFAVREQGGNKFIESPGTPVDTYSLLVGPAERENISVTARVHGTATGRRFPAFAIALQGTAGYRLQVSPGRRKIELWRGDEEKAGAPFAWSPGQWLRLRLEQVKTGEVAWRIRGRVWPDGTTEPSTWALSVEDNTAPRTGRSALLAYPIAGTPIRYDDIRIERVAP